MASPALDALHAQLSSLLARASAPRPGGVCVELERFAATYRAEAVVGHVLDEQRVDRRRAAERGRRRDRGWSRA